MSAPGQNTTIRKKRRKRRRRTPLFPFVLLGLLVLGAVYGIRWVASLHPEQGPKSSPLDYLADMAALRSEYSHYNGKPIEDAQVESRFRDAARMVGERNYPGAISVLEALSRKAAVPVVFHDMGVVYAQLTDYARAADAFREALARDGDYAATRQFLRTAKGIPLATADPYTREVEPNNDARTATLITLGVPVSGEITGSTDDQDCFRVIAPAAPRDLITVEVVNHSIEFTPRVHIYDANLRLLSWGETSAGKGESVRITGGPAPNTAVYVAISGADAHNGPYVLKVTAHRAFDSYEPNDDIMSSRRIAPGEEIDANIMDAEDTDFFFFQSPRAGTVSIDIRNRSQTLIPAITLYNGERRSLGFGPEIRKPGLGLHYSLQVEKDKTYYVQVWSQAGSAGAYTLRVD